MSALRLLSPFVLFLLALPLSGCILKYRAMKEENRALSQKVQQYQQDWSAAEAQGRVLQEKIAALEAEIAAKDTEIAAIKEREAATRRVMSDSQRNQAEALVDDMQKRMELENSLRLQLDEAESKREAAENDKRLLEEQLQEAKALGGELLAKLEQSTAKIEEMTAGSEALRAERDDARAERDDFRRQLQGAQASSTEAAAQMEQTSAQLRDKEKELAAAQRLLEDTKASQAARTKADDEAVAARRAAGDDLAAALGPAINAGKVAFLPGEEPRIVLLNDALFQTGTVLLSEDGVANLKTVAEALRGRPWKALRIEGHTDNTPVRNMPFVDNWDLAGARASAVARWLAAQSEFGASGISAESRAYFKPAATNDTAEGRRKNRRVEIIVEW